MKRALRRLSIALALLLAIPAAAVVALFAIDAEVYRDALIDQVEAATGRPFAIDGPIRIVPGLTPSLVAGRVRIGNLPSGPAGDLLRIERLEARLPLIPLLRGDVRIERLTLVRPELVLVADGKGSGNWALPVTAAARADKRDANGETKLNFSVRDARLRDGTVRYVEPMRTPERPSERSDERVITIAEARLRTASPSAPMRLSASGDYGGEAFSIEGDGPAIAALDAAAWPVAFKATLANAAFDVGGFFAPAGKALGRVSNESRFTFKADVGDVARIGRVFGLDLPAAKPLQAAGGIVLTDERLQIEDLDATVGASHFGGTLDVSFAGERPSIAGTLSFDAIDLGDFGIQAQSDPGSVAASQAPPANAVRDRLFPDTRLPVERLGDVDLDLAVKAGRVTAGSLDLALVAAKIVLRDRRLAVAPLQADLAGGTVKGEFSVDGAATLPAVTGRLEWRGLDLAVLLAQAGADLAIAGRTNLAMDIKGQGVSVRDLLASLDGSFAADLADGHIPGTVLDLLGEDLAARLFAIADNRQVTPLRCGIARFAIRGGVAESQAMALDSAKISLTGTGRTDLRRESLDFKLVPRPKDPSLMSLGIPVLVSGTYLAPVFVPDKGAAVAGMVGGAIGTVLLGPLGILIPLASTGTGEITDCIRLVREAKDPPPPTDPDVATPDRAAPRPDSNNPIDTIRGLFQNLERRLTR